MCHLQPYSLVQKQIYRHGFFKWHIVITMGLAGGFGLAQKNPTTPLCDPRGEEGVR